MAARNDTKALRASLASELFLGNIKADPSKISLIHRLEESRPNHISAFQYLEMFIDVVKYFKEYPAHPEKPVQNGAVQPSSEPREGSIRAYLNKFLESKSSVTENTELETLLDSEQPEEIVMSVLGAWMAMRKYFRGHPNGGRPIERAYIYRTSQSLNLRSSIDPLSCTLPELLKGSNLIPGRSSYIDAIWEGGEAIPLHTSPANFFSVEGSNTTGRNPIFRSSQDIYAPLDALEFAQIPAEELNIFTLANYAGVKIHWTEELCRHLLLSNHFGRPVLEVFALPSMLGCRFPKGVDTKFMREAESTYGSLFRPYGNPGHGHIVSKLIWREFWCQCNVCCCYRIETKALRELQTPTRRSGFRRGIIETLTAVDPGIQRCIENGVRDWSPEIHECLWPRILALQEFQLNAKPWNFWVLFRDRRNTVQYWTFFFAAFIIPATIIQVILSIIQVIKAF